MYKQKFTPDDTSIKYKVKLVEKGFKQEHGIDFDEVFSPVVKMTTLRAILALVTRDDMESYQMDVKTTFLHGDLHKEIYMQQPKGFVDKGKPRHVRKFKKSLYGLK